MRSIQTVPLRRRAARIAVKTLVALFAAAAFAVPANAADADAPVFSRDVAPIFMRHCAVCHRPGEVAPMSLLTYRDARPWARSIRRVVASGEMPPWFANPEHGAWANDARLSEEEIETIVAWVDGGAAPGDPALMPEPPRFRDGWQLGEPDYVIELPPVTVPANGPDLAPNQVVRLDIPERRWLRAVEFRPGDRTVNHHQIVFMGGFGSLGSGGGPERQRDDRPGGQAGGVDLRILGIWAAGAAPTVFPDGAGRWVNPGDMLLVNQHYHPNGESERTDRTRIGLHFGEGPLEVEVEAILASRMDFTIPAGAPNHRIVARHELGADSRIVSYFPHMHMRGRSMSFTAIYPDGSREVLLDVPEYDFDWQLFYYPVASRVLPAGTVVEVVARYDNSAANPDNPDPTRDVGFGFQSTDEMMVGIFELIEVGPGEAAKSAATGVAAPAAAADANPVVFSTDVGPILMKHCVGCHRPGEIAPMSLLTYREARPWARSIQRVVSSGQMPPWFASPEHGKWANDARLSPEEIETIVAWVEGGAKPGDLAATPEPPEFTEGWRLGEPDYVIELPEVTVPADGPDLFPNQFVRLNIAERRWVRAVEFRPGDRSVNHHQVAFMINPNQEREAANVRGETDAAGDDGRFNVLAIWAAGTAPTVFPDGAGRWVEPGEILVMNQHYHPNGRGETTDRTRIGLHFGEGEMESEISAILAGTTDFTIPAGASDHRLEARHKVRADSKIVSYFPHMHMRGRQMSFTAVYPDGRRELLLDVPQYDFDWQLFYYPQEPKLLPAGSVIEIVALYDNSAENPDNPDPTRDVGFGLESTDEMMFGVFELIELGPEAGRSAATGGE